MKIDTSMWNANDICNLEFCRTSFYIKKNYRLQPEPRNYFHAQVHHYINHDFWGKNYADALTFSKGWKGHWNKAVKKKGGTLKFRPAAFISPKDPVYIIGSYYTKGSRILLDFYEKNIWKKRENFLIDDPFKDLEVRLDGSGFRVKIDEMCMSDEGPYLIDYNMTKSSPEEVAKHLKRDPKIIMMSMAFRENYGKEEALAGKNLLRNGGRTVLAKITGDDHAEFAERLEKINREMMYGDFPFSPRFGSHCRECECFDHHWELFPEDQEELSKIRKPGYKKPVMTGKNVD